MFYFCNHKEYSTNVFRVTPIYIFSLQTGKPQQTWMKCPFFWTLFNIQSYRLFLLIVLYLPVCQSDYTELLTFHPGKQLAKTKQNMQQYNHLLIKMFKNQETFYFPHLKIQFPFLFKISKCFSLIKVYSLLLFIALMGFLIVFCLMMTEFQTNILIG